MINNHPLEKVYLLDKFPAFNSDRSVCGWGIDGLSNPISVQRSVLPDFIWEKLKKGKISGNWKDYLNATVARSDLSDALIEFARETHASSNFDSISSAGKV